MKLTQLAIIVVLAVANFSVIATGNGNNKENQHGNSSVGEVQKDGSIRDIIIGTEGFPGTLELCKSYLQTPCTKEVDPSICQFQPKLWNNIVPKPLGGELLDEHLTVQLELPSPTPFPSRPIPMPNPIPNPNPRPKESKLYSFISSGNNRCEASQALKYIACTEGFQVDDFSLKKEKVDISCRSIGKKGNQKPIDVWPKLPKPPKFEQMPR